MSAREQEMEAVRAAERSSGVISSSARKTSHLAGSSVGCAWSQEVTDAVSSLAAGSSETGNLVVIVSHLSLNEYMYPTDVHDVDSSCSLLLDIVD